MINKFLILVSCLILAGCPNNKQNVRVVNIPVPTISKIEPLEEFVGRCDKFSEKDNKNYEAIAKACKRDLEILIKRDQIHQRVIKQHNGD